jgi:hypothetical protein
VDRHQVHICQVCQVDLQSDTILADIREEEDQIGEVVGIIDGIIDGIIGGTFTIFLGMDMEIGDQIGWLH